VYCNSNPKAWKRVVISKDYHIKCFTPEVEKYCTENDIPFKIWPVADNAPGHTIHLDDFYLSCFSATKHGFTHSAYESGGYCKFQSLLFMHNICTGISCNTVQWYDIMRFLEILQCMETSVHHSWRDWGQRQLVKQGKMIIVGLLHVSETWEDNKMTIIHFPFKPTK
jgi:hypothetical protein